MPSRFCDQEDPCPLLRKAVIKLLSPEFDGRGFEIIVNGRGNQPHKVFFEYCPFCGTRIDPKFLSTIKVKKQCQSPSLSSPPLRLESMTE